MGFGTDLQWEAWEAAAGLLLWAAAPDVSLSPSLGLSFIRYCCSGPCVSCTLHPSPDNSSHARVLAWQEEAVALQAHRETSFLMCALFCTYSMY